MPNPVPADLRVDQVLTNISIAYMQKAEDFVADRVFPRVPSQVKSDRYVVYDRADWFRNEMEKRAPGTESAGSGWRIDNTPTFSCDVWALHKDVDDQLKANQRPPVDLDRDATLWLTQQGLIRRDKEWVDSYFKTGVWTTDRTGVASGPTGTQFVQWNQAASDPFNDVRLSIWNTKELTGFKPNTLVIGARVWQVLADHADLLERIKYTQGPAIPTPALVAQVLELDRVMIASGVEVTTEEGAASDTYAFIAGKHALLAYSAPAPSLMQPSAGYTFTWDGLVGAGLGTRIKRFEVPHLEAERVEIDMAFDMKLVAADLGVFFSGAVA